MRLSTWRVGALAAACAFACEAHAATLPVQSPERLSLWLTRQPGLAATDWLGVSWRSLAEIPAQQAAQRRLVDALKPSLPELSRWVAQMPVTGRVRLPSTDARWLLINPAADPVLQPGDSVDLPAHSEWVTVLQPSGLLCLVRHQPGLAAGSYVTACGEGRRARQAWVVQPDGEVFKAGLQTWNEHAQWAPAPGAWIWAPEDPLAVDAVVSQALAEFLATQGLAPAAAEGSVLQRRYPETLVRSEQLRDLPVTTNDWGVVGLWQTPTARFDKTGAFAVTMSTISPYNNLSVNLQPFDWMSAAFRYTGITNQPYGPANAAGDQTYKDKSADLKLRLWQESAWLPQVALGWRDILGTGVFSGEYVVANKRAGDLDFSLGLGFGYLGARGDVGNPLGAVSARFKDRPRAPAGSTGEFNPSAYFRGPAALFGGVQYQTPWNNLILKAEYEGNDYQHEFYGEPIKARSPFNFGAVWRALSWLDVSLAVERGRKVMFALSARSQLDGLRTPKLLDAPAPAISPRRADQLADPAKTARDIGTLSGFEIEAIEKQDRRWTAVAANPFVGYTRPAVDRALSALHRDAPADIDELAVRFDQRRNPIGEVVVQRDAWAKDKTQLLPPSQRQQPPEVTEARKSQSAEPVYDAKSSSLRYGLGLNYRQNLGGPDAFILYQLAVDASAEWRPRQDTWLSGIYRVGLIDNYDKFRFTAPSNLPRVRTYLREFSVTSNNTIPNLQLTHMGQLGNTSHYYLAYAGLLESMYAGAGVEYLYRPLNSRWAAGFDANSVRQREFNQKFGLRDYRVKTGHLNLFWDTGLSDVIVKASVGQYLAGDRGGTLDLSRTFNNGVTLGAYATKTNVSAAQFGEGSFDKGIYISIPFDAMLPKSGPSTAMILYNPLIRDGGAKLARRYSLYELTYLRDRRAMSSGIER